MTSDQMLQAHLREFDRKVARLRAILAEPHYDNDQSPEAKCIGVDIADVIERAFTVKQCLSAAESAIKRENAAAPCSQPSA